MDLTQTQEGFLVTIECQDTDMLLPVLQQFVIPGTTVMSDLWRAYNTIDNLGYQYLTVNHSIYFVDLILHIMTNHMESMWCRAK